MIGWMEAADRVARERDIRRLRRELKLVRKPRTSWADEELDEIERSQDWASDSRITE